MSDDEEQPPKRTWIVPSGFDALQSPHYDAVDAQLTTQETMTATGRFRVKLSNYHEVSRHVPTRGPPDEWYWRVASSPMGVRILNVVLQRLMEHVISDGPVVQAPKLTAPEPWD